MLFFFFIAVAILVWVSVWHTRRNQTTTIFTNAASRLGLRVSSDGTVLQRPWIYGERNGIRIDIRPFTRTKDGSRTTWTGYRLRFDKSIDLKISGDNDARRRVIARLSNRFSESEIESDGLFCARSSLAEDSSRIVADVEYLLSAARELRNSPAPAIPSEPVHHPKARLEIDAPQPTPPPLPDRDKAPTEYVAEVVQVIDESALDEPTFLRQQDEQTDFEPDSDSPLNEEAEADPQQDEETSSPIELVDPEPAAEKAIEVETEEETSFDSHHGALDNAARDLFETGRNRFEVGRRFDAEYAELSLEGTGRLRRVDRYSNDRIFGRGPGFIAEVEIRKLENPSGGLQVITAVIQLPDEEESGMSIRHWRERVGEPVLACGTLIRCDAFAGKIFLQEGLVDAVTTLA